MNSENIQKPRKGIDLPEVVSEPNHPSIHLQNVSMNMDRRRFLKLSGLTTGGLILAFHLSTPQKLKAGEKETFAPNAYLQVAPDGKVTLKAITPEIGQGVKTALPMVLAEELSVPWESVTVVQSRIDYQAFGPQFAGGSMATPIHFDRLRKAGAAARMMLVAAAAEQWGIKPEECSVEKAVIHNSKSGESLSYAEICSAAAKREVPAEDTLIFKNRKDYRLLGKWIPGVDNHAIVTGKPLFGIDQQHDNLLYAVYIKCPATGGKAIEANLDAVRASRGVVDAFIVDEKGDNTQLLSGVAIVADSTWNAFNASNHLNVKWDRSTAAKETWSDLVDQAKEKLKGNGEPTSQKGNFTQAESEASQVLEAYYQYPFMAHATLEPMNCTAHYHDGIMEIWAPTQTPQSCPDDVEIATGISKDKVKIHQLRIGGGFGRRLMNDYVCEVAVIAQKVNQPVKLMWSREEDMAHDYYRVGGFHQLKGTLDSKGKLTGWKGHFVTFTEGGEKREPVRGGGMNNNASPLPFLEHLDLQETRMDLKIPCGWWRAPGSCSIAWVVQSFLHELSHAAGKDHLQFMLDLMGESRWTDEGNNDALHTGRAKAVIKLAAEKAGWGRPLPKGHGRGLAFYFCHKGHFAEVAEVSVDDSQKLTLHRVVVAGDVGLILNKSGAENQIEGSVIDGYSSVMGQEITFTDGAVDQSNFHDYSLLKMPAQPEIEIHMIESDFPPTGLGEPALPPLGPALCNAIFEATGKRVRTLPLAHAGFRV